MRSSLVIPSDLRPGDHLGYNVSHFMDDPIGFAMDGVIRVKTWSDTAHIEVYDGNRMSLASRASGVNRYPFRSAGLIWVRRPHKWNHGWATHWFETVAKGQKYDWLGLLCFTLAVKRGSPRRMFCSEFARNLGLRAGSNSFDDLWPGDKTAPGSFQMVGGFATIYHAP